MTVWPATIRSFGARGVILVAIVGIAGLPKFLTQVQVHAIVNGTARKLAPLRNQALLLVRSRMGWRSRTAKIDRYFGLGAAEAPGALKR